jgi:hypothetical protein
MDIKLLSVKDSHGQSTGYFTCSACDTHFKPHPLKPEAMIQEFTFHVMSQHPDSPREDDNGGNHIN